MPSCASQSNPAFRDIPRLWPAALRHMQEELLVFPAVTAFRCESDDSESDLTPMQEEVIVGARCGPLLYKFTKIIYTLSNILISYCSTSAFIPHQSMSPDMYRK